VQLALFDDRYRVASADYVPADPATVTDGLFKPFTPPDGAKLHPLNQQDTSFIQRRFFELGYYPKLGDGIWGLASHSALRDFKVAQKLPPDDTWDPAVESVLMSSQALPASATPFGEWTLTGSSCSDQSVSRRLAVSAQSIVAGQRVCQLEPPLARDEGGWHGTAMCAIEGRSVPARVSFTVVDNHLVDYSVLGNQSSQKPTFFDRCR
jgi:hypothetical protein